MANDTLFIGADHRGFALKARLVAWLGENGAPATDLGTNSEERCDAVDFARRMAEEFKQNPAARGILICGSGQAMAMTANRYKAIRAALCFSPEMVRAAREHNDANVLVLGADFTDEATALECARAFLTTAALGGRYAERREKLERLGGL